MNPLLFVLPKLLAAPLGSMPELGPTVELLFAEAFDKKEGRQAAVDRLAEYYLVLLLRSAMDGKLIEGGIVTALSDSHLGNVATKMHEEPERAWTLEELGQIAGMSRARFAAHFLSPMNLDRTLSCHRPAPDHNRTSIQLTLFFFVHRARIEETSQISRMLSMKTDQKPGAQSD